jgi:S-adenosylmethionine:tRNA ribosyltransferase-isomerase
VRVSDFHFELPEELIAQHPPRVRGASRMLVLEKGREQGTGNGEQARLVDAMFRDLPELLRAGDLLVLNDSRVLPGRLFAARAGKAETIEVLLVEEVQDRELGTGNRQQGLVWRALVKPARKVRVGERLEFLGSANERNTGILHSVQNDKRQGEVELSAEVVGVGEFGERTLRFDHPNEQSSPGTPTGVEDFYGVVGRIGHMPLPPYIRRARPDAGAKAQNSSDGLSRGLKPAAIPDFEEEDRERYQTVYADAVGSAAAPTAGLHFTPEVLRELEARGVEIAYVTLHVGLGTFQPVRADRLEDIKLHSERYTLPVATAAALNRAMAEGRRVVAVGTTTTRVLEHVAMRADGEQVPRAKAQFIGGPIVPGAKSRAISEASDFAGNDSEARDLAAEGPLRLEGHSGATSIFIGPGHRFRVVGGLLTNFHLPESTLLMLVSAMAGRERVLEAYAHAVREGYRFYSYGDCMLVLPDGPTARGAVTS